MKLIKQSYEILEQEIPVRKLDDYSGSHFREQYIDNMYKHIEKCGRTCYKSLDRITENSSKRFVDGLIKSKHLSVLEHGVIYLRFPYNDDCDKYAQLLNKYYKNHYSRVSDSQYSYVTTNYRVIIENGWEDDLQYLCEPTEYHEKRHTVLLHTCIHTYKDLTRHRKMSFSIESTRYCNYSKTDKFGEIKFVLLPWIDIHEGNTYDSGMIPMLGESEDMSIENQLFIADLCHTEDTYNMLTREYHWKPEQAAEVLPQCTAADVVMSGYDSDWKFVFSLRSDETTGKVHPLVLELMKPLHEEFKNKKWIQ